MTPAHSSIASADTFDLGRINPPTLHDVADAKTLDKVFAALASDVRRGILAALHDQGGPLSSHDIARRFDIKWQGISRHLRLLTNAGLLICEEHKNERAYTLNKSQLRRVAGRWVMRVATEGTRDKGGTLVFEFDE
jgi:DNA-binding transcriptional ArsR family regulator